MVMTLIVKTPRAWPDVVRHSQLHIHSRLTHTPMSATNGLPPKSPQSLIAWSRHIEAFGPIAPGFAVANRRARWSQAHRVSSSGTSRPDAASPGCLGKPPDNESGLDSAHRGRPWLGSPEMLLTLMARLGKLGVVRCRASPGKQTKSWPWSISAPSPDEGWESRLSRATIELRRPS